MKAEGAGGMKLPDKEMKRAPIAKPLKKIKSSPGLLPGQRKIGTAHEVAKTPLACAGHVGPGVGADLDERVKKLAELSTPAPDVKRARDERGRFKPGAPPGPGRPRAPQPMKEFAPPTIIEFALTHRKTIEAWRLATALIGRVATLRLLEDLEISSGGILHRDAAMQGIDQGTPEYFEKQRLAELEARGQGTEVGGQGSGVGGQEERSDEERGEED